MITRDITAIHESGHAVVAYLLGIRFKDDGPRRHAISLRPTQADLTGVTNISIASLTDIKTVDKIAFTLAGGLAQYRYSGLSDGLVADAAYVTQLLDWTSQRTERVITAAVRSEKIEDVLSHLDKTTLKLAETAAFGSIISSAFIARSFLDCHWPAVEILAEYLMDRESLTARELMTAFKATGMRRQGRLARRLQLIDHMRQIIAAFWETRPRGPERLYDPEYLALMRHHGFISVPGAWKDKRTFVAP